MGDVMNSLLRIPEKQLAKRFYELLLDSDPRIKVLFSKTDFNKQTDLLIHGIIVLLEYADGKSMGKMAINRLGELHSRKRMNITPDMYPIWVNCLMKTVSEMDPEFTPELEDQWRKSLQKGLDIMIKMH
jgi:hemoglobin-like flavoprotein